MITVWGIVLNASLGASVVRQAVLLGVIFLLCSWLSGSSEQRGRLWINVRIQASNPHFASISEQESSSCKDKRQKCTDAQNNARNIPPWLFCCGCAIFRALSSLFNTTFRTTAQFETQISNRRISVELTTSYSFSHPVIPLWEHSTTALNWRTNRRGNLPLPYIT